MNRGLHGYTHEAMSLLTTQQERDVLQKSIEVLTKFTGKHPRGFTAPSWTPSRETVSLYFLLDDRSRWRFV